MKANTPNDDKSLPVKVGLKLEWGDVHLSAANMVYPAATVVAYFSFRSCERNNFDDETFRAGNGRSSNLISRL